ncbi:MAG: Flp pilus assembly complex ATPase component TadA, partial [Desulfobulbaceae bacterium]|nr:Flp pilus assembly complex ATPase component TadA [Desulfobulbaceae bacterium]
MAQEVKRKRFGDILVEAGLISATQLQEALDFGKEKGLKVGEALQELGYVNELTVARALSKQLKMPFADLDKVVIDPELASIIPEMSARKHKVIPLGKRPGETLVAFADPLNIFAIDEISRHIKDKMVVCVALESRIVATIDRIYAAQRAAPEAAGGAAADVRQPDTTGAESAAVAAVNELLLLAVRDGASDIHIEPGNEHVRARLRVDGVLRVAKEHPMDMHAGIVSRLKIMSQLDIGERRKPQDGRFEIPVSGREFDVRVSTLPLKNGEKVVMRLLDKSKVRIDLKDLGFEEDQKQLFVEHLAHPHEILLVTGPTGSGKTTTLYGALNHINSVGKNIVTVEDPVEYELPGVNQVQVNPKADLTFASSLRSILRQDPDIVMIGEIRDIETAEIAIQAALTGHMVLSTLHTNDSCGAITRLIDMGIPPFLISSALGLVLAQRLLRLLCPRCKEEFSPPASVREDLGLTPEEGRVFYKTGGCDNCEKSGYRGRLGIYEVLPISKGMEGLIMAKASSHEMYDLAVSEGLITLRQAGIRKMFEGLTTLDEVLRVS